MYLKPDSTQTRGNNRTRLGSNASSSVSSASSTALQMTSSQIGRFGIEDMELWHHYIKHTSEATSVMFGGRPELGLSCDYLLHGMLATAAIHLGYLHPEHRQRYNLLSRQHIDLALGPFQRAMASISDENIIYLFTYSTLLVVCSLAASQGAHTYGGSEPSSGIADWVICVRGCRSITAAANFDIGGLPIGPWIEHMVKVPCTPGNTYKLSPEEEGSFSRIESLLATAPLATDLPSNEVEAYLHAMEKLRHTFAFTVDSFNATMTLAMKDFSPEALPERLSRRLFVTLWPFSVSELFVQLLSETRPPALIIMAHYCLILRRAKDCWYMAESGLRIFQAIQHNLGEEWSTYIEYPRRVFGV